MYDEGDFDYYFFDKNIFGDIVGIYNENGRKICTYTYDAWGVCETTLSSGISSTERAVADQYNPFRYRGYYYDVETGYYYLQTRYYNPEWGRFLNADSALYGNMLDPTTTHAVVFLYYHSPNQKQNPHYHLHNYIFNGKHKHFHVWYGLGG